MFQAYTENGFPFNHSLPFHIKCTFKVGGGSLFIVIALVVPFS